MAQLLGDQGAGSAHPGRFEAEPVRWAVMVHEWRNLTFLHWRYDPAVVQASLPPGYRVETFDGSAWVALVPFEMVFRPPHVPAVPWLSTFPETNVRTYVTAPDGTTGVWFLSLDASRLHAVVGARTTYGLPYFWSAMSVASVGPVVTYRSRRRWPGPKGAASEVAIEVGAAYGPGEPSEHELWLTARFRLFTVFDGGCRAAPASHAPWALHHVRVLHCRSDLFEAAGLPSPEGDPLAHWSPGVEVRIGLPHQVRPDHRGLVALDRLVR